MKSGLLKGQDKLMREKRQSLGQQIRVSGCLLISVPLQQNVVDDCTVFCRNYFLKDKSELKDNVIELIKDLDSKYDSKLKCL